MIPQDDRTLTDLVAGFQGLLRRHAVLRVVFFLLVSLLCVGIGLSTGLGLANLLEDVDLRWQSTWVRLPDPPSMPVELIGASAGCLAINAEDGFDYLYCEGYDQSQGQWERLDGPSNFPDRDCPEDQSPAPPTGTLQVVEDCLRHEAYDYTWFALVGDGTLQVYRITGDAFKSIDRALTMMVLGSFSGLVVGIGFIMSFLHRKIH